MANQDSKMAAHIRISNAQTSRMRAMVIPREHGAWGMLLVPLVTGGIVALRGGGNASALTLFLVAALSLFWLRTPVESWLGTSAIKAQTERERKIVLRTIVAIAALALASVIALLWNGNRTWKVVEVAAGPDGRIGFAFGTADGSVIARFTMDSKTGRVTRTG